MSPAERRDVVDIGRRLRGGADPHPATRLHDPRRCLPIAVDLMSEYERVFEVLAPLKFQGGVTREKMKGALLDCTSMTAVRSATESTRRHLAAGAAHLRTVHPTMNEKRAARGGDPVYEAVKSSFEQSAIYTEPYRPVAMILGELPTRYFLGVEPARLIPVALIHMRETMARLEGPFWLSPRNSAGPGWWSPRDPDHEPRDPHHQQHMRAHCAL